MAATPLALKSDEESRIETVREMEKNLRISKMIDKKLWVIVICCALNAMILFVLCFTPTDSGQVTKKAVFSNLNTSNTSSYSYPVQNLSQDDYHQLINLKNFTFTILNKPCNGSSPILLVLVHSNPKHFATRKVLRTTWGKNSLQVKVLFMLGLVKSHRLKVQIEKENEEFGDLIQGSFLDTYRNMTYKHVMVFKYAIYHCPQAKYILKTDDDIFVNMPLMLNFLTEDLLPFGGSRMIFCTLEENSPVVRKTGSKWRVSFTEYPAEKYPTYCLGWVILYSPNVVFDLYKEAQKTDYFWIDDVHITGILVEKIHLTRVDVNKLVLSDNAFHRLAQYKGPFLYGPPNMKNREIKDLWEYVKSHRKRVSLLKYLKRPM
ncbi:beta-1,3-galactosyltransferase 5 [Tribolium castaneum]|uniref:beta-1,3-galactosyltransferase 5 n=1 Tax=Tribolium castaneum TaxID=7070 RepID=UPI00077DE871|nr:PREDICTED: beta-1,3-galactosyltransferase 5 [Tribolium castaneum]|eukprot:XP_969838.2 PREDICTED: beta-1,3-galactosyltransferase 5 [Tribolium castaneum]